MTDAHGQAARSGRGLCTGPRRSKPKATGKWRDNIRRGGPQARQSEQRETGGISPDASRHHELPETATQGPLVRTYS